jgi:hypothetical protein
MCIPACVPRSSTPARRWRRSRPTASGQSTTEMNRQLMIWLIVAVVPAVPCSFALAGQGRAKVVLLGEGRLGDQRWFATVVGNDPSKKLSVPCEGILLRAASSPGVSPEREFNEDMTTVCGTPTADEPPMTLSVGVDEHTSKEGAIFVILADPSVARVRLYLGRDGIRNIRLKRLDGSRARVAGVAPLRYAAFGKAGTQCLTRVISFDAKGKVMFKTPGGGCKRAPTDRRYGGRQHHS